MKRKLTEQLEDFINPIIWNMDEDIFGRMFSFIMNLDPEMLDTEQLQIAMNIIQDMEAQDDEDTNESVLKSKKSNMNHNRYSKKYYRLNKEKVKKNKEKFDKAMKNKKKVMAVSDRTATKRDKTRYNTRGHTN